MYNKGLSMYSDTSSTTGSSGSSDAFTGSHQISLAHYGSQKNMWIGDVERTKAQNSYKGQLKVSIYVNYGLLTAHVVSGRHLKSKSSGTCNSYVKVCLMPDEEKRTRCKTDISPESNNPLYDEKFSFELLDDDIDKRLFVSVWNKEEGRKQCEFLGCMSFGIRHISQDGKEVGGWYYLLPGDMGKRKHLRVSEKQQQTNSGGLTERSNNATAKVNTRQQPPQPANDLFWLDTHMVTVKRSPRGYGFTISGACPVQVCRVEVGSYAQRVGLKGGDRIMKIDGIIVTRSNADTVARIIRNSNTQVILEIQRQRSLDPICLDTLDSSPRRPICSSTPDRFDARMEVEGYQVSPWRRHRHQPYPGVSTGRTPPRSPSLKTSLRQSSHHGANMAGGENSGSNNIQGYPYPPAFETQDYGWIDGNQNADSHGFKVPTLQMPADMAGYAALDASMTSNTLPKSMKFNQNQSSSLQRVPSHASAVGSSSSRVQTKDYGWLDSQENLSAEDQQRSSTLGRQRRAGQYRAQSQSTGTLPNMRKKVSFKDF